MSIYAIGILLGYMSLNVFTDLKYRKRKYMAFAIFNCRYRNHVFCWNKNWKRDCDCTSYGISVWFVVRDI